MPYHSFSVTKTARYFTAGPAIAEAKGALIALHGYCLLYTSDAADDP